MQKVRQMIYEELSNMRRLTALVGTELYTPFAPETAAKPYVVFRVGGMVGVDYDTGSERLETRDLTIDVWGLDTLVIQKIQEAIEAEFNQKEELPSLLSTKILKIIQTSDDLYEEEERDPQGNPIWHGVCIYEITISRNIDDA